mmetsp:Transcript_18000/g.41633  ORF Transcript_18000/g.41633 Transcript_18000/m.41633 type:complete len:101 (-) Transcript_18000:19-321(-)
MLPKYRELALDETAREAVLEAMEQHNIKPSEGARAEFRISEISIPPKNKKEQDWRVFSSPQEAVVAGWKPGQTFGFVATNVAGFKQGEQQDLFGHRPGII